MGIFGGIPKPQAAKATPVTPRLSDAELTARDEAAKTRKRVGIEDQILSLGRPRNENRQQQSSSLLGRAAA
jgi:hypothetical protein